MAGSASERAMRDYAAGRLREMLPGARIIHELVVGPCRADLAAVQAERVTLVEIKSEKDTLKRLDRQIEAFERAAHQVIVVAHERWFDRTPYNNGAPRFAPSQDLDAVSSRRIWAYPEQSDRPMGRYGAWCIQQWWLEGHQPKAANLLGLLWKAELIAEAARHGIPVKARFNIDQVIRQMVWDMTGREIAQAACRQLRQRHFPEADPAIAA